MNYNVEDLFWRVYFISQCFVTFVQVRKPSRGLLHTMQLKEVEAQLLWTHSGECCMHRQCTCPGEPDCLQWEHLDTYPAVEVSQKVYCLHICFACDTTGAFLNQDNIIQFDFALQLQSLTRRVANSRQSFFVILASWEMICTQCSCNSIKTRSGRCPLKCPGCNFRGLSETEFGPISNWRKEATCRRFITRILH